MSTSPGAKFSAGGFKDLGTALEGIVKKANAATAAIEKVFTVPSMSQDALEQVTKDLNDVAYAFYAIEDGAKAAARAIGKAIGGIKFARKNGVRIGAPGASGGSSGGGSGGGGAAGGAEEPTDGPWKANWVKSMDAAMSANKFVKKQEAMDLKRQASINKTLQTARQKAARATEKLELNEVRKRVRMDKLKDSYRRLEMRDVVAAAKEQAALDKLTYRLRSNIAKMEAKKAASRPDRVRRAIDNLQNMGFNRFKTSAALRTLFGGPDSAFSKAFGGRGPLGLSRYGPGALGVLGRYPVFRKPFPGSDRNVFSLGDATAAAQNVMFGIGNYLENSFTTLTASAVAVNRAFSGIVTGGIGMFSPFLGGLLGSISDLFIGALEKMNAAIAGVIGSLTRMGTALIGFASRAVEAASDLTEAVNAARVIAGPQASAEMLRYATQLQRQFGLSATDAMKAMGRMAGMMRNLGDFSQEEAGMVSSRLYRYAVDIGSVVNKSAEEVGIAMMSGFAGRFTPLRRFMIGMSAPQLDTMAKGQGITKPGVRTDYEARIRMFVEEFGRQSGLFIGDLERTQYEFANQRRKFLGQFEAMFVMVGKVLEPFAKTVMYVANDLMSSVLDVIEPFTKSAKDNMVELTMMERFGGTLRSFVEYALNARNAIIGFARAIWASRDVIVAYAKDAAQAFVALTAGIVNYSVQTLKAALGFVDALGGVLPMIKSFGSALFRLSDWIDRNILGGTGSGSTPDQTRALYDRLNETMKAQEQWAAANSGNATGEFARKQAEAARRAIREIEPYLGGQRKVVMNPGERTAAGSFVTPDKSIPGEAYARLAKLAGIETGFGMEAMFGDIDVQFAAIGKKIRDTVSGIKIEGVQQSEVDKYFARLEGVMSSPGVVAPRPDMGAGRLVQYFDPAQFRNAIQERESTGSMIADNTAKSADFLGMIVDYMKAGRTNPLITPILPVTAP